MSHELSSSPQIRHKATWDYLLVIHPLSAPMAV